MSVYVTGDHHFFHNRIIRYACRPFDSVRHMNDCLEQNWNATIGPEDTVYCLGDFALVRADRFSEATSLFNRLNGRKHLVKGNHDKDLALGLGWDEVHQAPVTLGGVVLTHHGDDYMRANPLHSERAVFCAHVHEVWKMRANLLNVGVDVWHFRPVPLEAAKEYWQYRFEYWQSHGRDA